MRTRTKNLLIALFSVVFAIILFSVGVYAASTATTTITNTFTFIPEGEFFVQIKGWVEGCREAESTPNYVHHYEEATSFQPWNVGNLSFSINEDESVNDIVFKFELQNYSIHNLEYEFESPVESQFFTYIETTKTQAEGLEDLNSTEPPEIITMNMTISLKTTESRFVREDMEFKLHINLQQA